MQREVLSGSHVIQSEEQALHSEIVLFVLFDALKKVELAKT